jgi:hypothetical protein
MSVISRVFPDFFPALGLMAIVAVAYFPVNNAGAIWDDNSYLLENPTIRDPHGLGRIFREPRASPQYYPLVFAGFWLEHQLWGFDLGSYHRVNLVLHAVGTLLVWRVARGLVPSAAWLAAAIFAVHPVHVESVAWIAERKNVQSTVFYLMALLVYRSYLDHPGLVRYAAAFLLYIAALGSKTVTCSLPAAILLLVWAERGTIRIRDVGRLIPYFATGVLAAAVTSYLERHHVGAVGADWEISALDRILIAGRALWFYAGRLACPTHLMFIYPRWVIDATDFGQWLAPLSVVGLILGLFLARGQIGRWPITSALYFAGTLTPALGFFNVYPMRYSFVADHFVYLASLGLILPAAWLLRTGASRLMPRAKAVGPAIVIATLMLLTYQRAKIFESQDSLWRDTLGKNPGCWMAWNNLGVRHLNRGELAEALPMFEHALALKSDYLEARSNLGTVLEEQGDLDGAESQLRQALALGPNYWRAHYALGLVHRKQGRNSAAAAEFGQVLRLKPDHRGARIQLDLIR